MTRTFGRLPAVIVAEWLDRVLDGGPGAERRSRFGAIDRLAQTCRHGARSLRRSPAFLWSAVLLLGLGVGAVTTVFTLVDHVMLRRLPYPTADRLFEVTHGSHSGPLWRGMQDLQSVEVWAATSTEEVNLTGVARPEELRAARVTQNFFALFGARPAVGRLLAGDDFESTDRVVLSAGIWERTFGGDPAAVGGTLVINGRPLVVVGVVDPSFTPPEALVGNRVDLWRAVDWADPGFESHGYHVLSVAGRLAPSATLCANTLGFAERRGDVGTDRMIKVSHTGDAPKKMVEAAESLLGALVERFEAVATQYRRLKGTRLPEPAFTRLVLDEVAPDPRRRANFNPEARTAELVLGRAERKRQEVRRLWDEGAGHTGDHSAWEAYNAVVEAIDHNAELWPVRGGAYRTASLLDGGLLALKQNVLANLSRYTVDWAHREMSRGAPERSGALAVLTCACEKKRGRRVSQLDRAREIVKNRRRKEAPRDCWSAAIVTGRIAKPFAPGSDSFKTSLA